MTAIHKATLLLSLLPLAVAAQEASPISITVETIFRYSLIDGNLPHNFPSNQGSSYNKAYQGTFIDGVLYTNDFEQQQVLSFNADGMQVENSYQGTDSHGITSDQAGNLIIRNDGMPEAPSRLRIYRHGSSEAVDIDFYLLQNGICNYISASGDIFSEEGGYVYFYPQSCYAVNAVKIANGRFVETLLAADLSQRTSIAGYVIPTGGDPLSFLYNARQHGYYRCESGSDCGEFLNGNRSNTPPNRNATAGGAYFNIAGHEIFLHPSGPDYCGGFTLRDVTAGNEPVANIGALGTKGIDANTSSATFFTVQPVDDTSAIIYEYCFGAGYAAYRLTAQNSAINEVATSPQEQEIYTITGLKLSNSATLPPGIYIIKPKGQPAKIIKM